MPKIKSAVTLCKTIMRNGYDAYAINAPLQKLVIEKTGKMEVDIACACDVDTLIKIFPNATAYNEDGAVGVLREQDVTLYFYPADVEDASHPERAQLSITPRLLRILQEEGQALKFNMQSPRTGRPDEGFADFDACGCVKLHGIPSFNLSQNYLRAIRALRFAANFDLPIEPQTWMAIIRSAPRILDYVPAREIMEEWRLVAAESMWKFVLSLIHI